MSTQQHTGAPAELPELSASRIDEIEKSLFADIAHERTAARTRSARRGRLWLAGGAAAAVIAVAAIIAPAVGQLVSPGAGSSDSAIEPGIAPDAPVDSGADDGAATTEEDLGGGESDESGASGGSTLTDPDQREREIITTASATVVVDDVAVTARLVGNSAVAHGGYVEGMSVGTDGIPTDPQSGVAEDSVSYPYPYPYPSDAAWITVRVPSDELPAVVDELAGIGEVTASAINRQDVTEQTVDLRARIEAAQASVDRLLDLMSEATSTADLLAAEAALSERQALLESYQQQLEMLEGQVAMSSLTVTLTPVVESVEADPAGFADGLLAGWNGLVATLNGIVIALGFLLPWLAVAAVVGLVVWAIVRWVRRRRERRRADASPPARSGETTDPTAL
jgi:hypothetical protein